MADIMQRMGEAVWVIEGFGERNSARDAVFDAGLVRRTSSSALAQHDMRANAGIVTAEGVRRDAGGGAMS